MKDSTGYFHHHYFGEEREQKNTLQMESDFIKDDL